MQVSFTMHYAKEHPNDHFQCEYCSHTVLSPNSLFKHQCSHLYLKHACDICEKCFQFPSELQQHSKIHTGSGLFPCLHCDKKYTTSSAMLEHAKSHNVNLQCDLCPLSVEKRYNSTYALAQHKRGMHGPGWNSPCGINYKWKSRYSRHLNSGCNTSVCKVNLLSTVHFMNNAYMQLVHLFIDSVVISVNFVDVKMTYFLE